MQQSLSSKNVGFIPSILLSFFVLLYFGQLFSINYFSFAIGGIVVFAGFLAYLKTKESQLVITKNSLLLAIYFIFLASVLSFASLFALNPVHSVSRALISIGIYSAMFFIYRKVATTYIQNIKWGVFLSKTFTVLMVVIIVGQMVVPDWRMGIGGVRITGGTNPNTVSFFALFIIFISHFNGLTNKWTKLNKINWLLAVVILLWSMSRGSILAFAAFYAVYFGWYFVKGGLNFLLKGRLSKKFVRNSFIVSVFAVIVYFIMILVRDTNFYRFTILRLTGSDGFSTRTQTWDTLLAYFNQNPLFGGIGWWNATNVLHEGGSPHSLYVRLLSEVGVVGTVAALALPIFIVLGLIFKSYLEKNALYEKVKMLTASFLIAVFVTQITEDIFLVGYFELKNIIIIFSIALGSALLQRKPYIANDRSYNM